MTQSRENLQIPVVPSRPSGEVITVMNGVSQHVKFASLDQVFNKDATTWFGKPLAVLYERIAGQSTIDQSLENIELNLLEARERVIREQAVGVQQKELLFASAKHSLVEANAHGYKVLERLAHEKLAKLGDKKSRRWLSKDIRRRTVLSKGQRTAVSSEEQVGEEPVIQVALDVSKLPPTHREVMEMFNDGKTLEEIAEAMGRDRKNIEELVAEAQRQLDPPA